MCINNQKSLAEFVHQAAYIKAKEEAAEMREKLIKTVINLVQRGGFSIEEAADITGLSAEEIEKLQKN